MKRIFNILAVLLVAITVVSLGSNTASAQTKQLVMYMQMGGDKGAPSVLARTNGAEAAAKALGIELHEQYASWDAKNMIDQFNQAIAAAPDCIEIMGHPGEDAMSPLVDKAEAAKIVVTSGNNPLPNIEAKYKSAGFGYAGADLYNGGYLTGQAMVAAGLKAGDKALVWDIWHQEGRSRSSQGVFDALEKTLGKGNVDKLDVTADVDSDVTKGIPILTAYLQAHPDLKAIGTQHGNITAILPKILKQSGKKPGDVIVGGIDLGPDTVQGIKDGFIAASFDQVLYLQGFYPVQQCWLTKTYLIPGLHSDTGVGEVTPQNVAQIAPLIDQGYR
ncbi:MAG TPA: substrate-binding domain-containing protein [Aggregatilineales bacterium]|nr:substrate-binding domain-containing protein [Aggregatilineales bacterium]